MPDMLFLKNQKISHLYLEIEKIYMGFYYFANIGGNC